MSKSFDVIVIGAGSIGVPSAMALAASGRSVLVIDDNSSPGQGNNKKAIGGVRATHSDFGKIQVCLRSIEIFSTWKSTYGMEIGWQSNGYSYPAYSEADETRLKELLKIQKSYGLNISWISPEEYSEKVPGIMLENLRGSTFSPRDGSCSPMLACNAFYFKSLEHGAKYAFNEKVIALEISSDKIISVKTNKNVYACGAVVNTAGNNASDIGKMAGIELPVIPDSHEAGITEPVQRFFEPMVVDMRPVSGSKNYYFYQNNEGQVVFCITPNPPHFGTDNDDTSEFLPQVARRMVNLYPRLSNLKVRRTWRGQYPMSPDGFPIVGKPKGISNFVNAVGMCGQGFMLGPGMGELITRMV
ncbi:MAG: FAD-binding oxidoreductase, partial [Candidatus Cloacimonetes bacterium]|nr:FAD-binding oxidoreductase [Candidatus Cloacimonadota bacterium]